MVPLGTLIAATLAATDPLPAAARPVPMGTDPVPARGSWYGSQTLLVDAAALGVGALAFTHRQDPRAGYFPSTALTLGLIASAGYLAGAPLVHALNGRTDAAGTSAALRFGLPAAAGLASALLWGVAWRGCSACTYAIPVTAGIALTVPIVVDAVDARSAAPAAPFLLRF